MADEKTVDIELLDDMTKVDGVFYHKGDKVTLPESTYNSLVEFGSVRKWSDKGKQSSDTKSARSVEGQAQKSADAEQAEQQHEPAEAVAVARVEGQSQKSAQRR